MKYFRSILFFILFMRRTILVVICCLSIHLLKSQTPWKCPIEKEGRLGSPLVETSPFVFHDNLYLLENNQKFWDVPGAQPGDYFVEDEVRIRDLSSGDIISVPLKNHGFGTVLVWRDTVYVFAGSYGVNKPWRKITDITMTSSANLIHWSAPITILQANQNEYFFNTAVCRGKDDFILLYETSDPRWTPFTFRYVRSEDLVHWEEMPGAFYGRDKYVGGPALYFEGGFYYTLYLHSMGGSYETRIARSVDLVTWEDAPPARPFITFDPSHKNIPLIDPEISESNASDVELCYYQDKTIIYFTGSDQTTAGDLQRAIYHGTPKTLFESFFSKDESTVTAPPYSITPTPQQLAFQQRQLGAFIHFGPATYVSSDMMQVPPADLLNPRELNAEQWAQAARSFGAKHMVLTTKHHNGYCLWPTSSTSYNIRHSPWKNGAGDVVMEFVEACREYDLKVGFYLSGGDKHFGCMSTPDPQGERKIVGDVHKYFPLFLEQLRELLTNYGDIDYLWFDGAYDPFGWDVMNPTTMKRYGHAYGDAIASMVRNLQPNAVIMGGTKPDVRWSGSEQGGAAYPLWNVVKPGEGYRHWVGSYGAGWIPVEANLHTRKTWFWTADSDHTLRDIDFLMSAYLESVGHGANLLVNMTPDTTGLIPIAEVERLREFGQSIQSYFSDAKGSATIHSAIDQEIFLDLPHEELVNLVVLEETLSSGQHITHYEIEAMIQGVWRTIARGETIGRKRIQFFNPIKARRFKLIIRGAEGQTRVRSFSLFHANH